MLYVCKMKSLASILIVILLVWSASAHVYYVKLDNYIPQSCPGQPCLTLDQYTQQAATYFTTGSTFLFLPGNHTLWTIINLTDISDVVFRGLKDQSSDITIIHGNGGNISCAGVINLTFDGLTLKTANLQVVRSKGVLLSDSIILDNSVSALNCSNSTITVNNSHFEGNKGDYGGAIRVELLTKLEIIDSTFINNEAYYDGGAIHVENSSVSVKGTSNNIKIAVTFSQNFARRDGGAMLVDDNAVVLFSGMKVLFENNHSERDGGGICSLLSSLDFASSITLFSGNKARKGSGGAIWLGGEKIELSRNTIFINNSADNGGALYGFKTEVVFNENITFSFNSAGKGGAMYFEDVTSLKLLSGMKLNTSYNNATEYGGAIYHVDKDTITHADAIDQCQDDGELPDCFIQLSGTDLTELINDTSTAIYSYYNSAGKDGSFLYGVLLDRCRLKLSIATIVYIELFDINNIILDGYTTTGNNSLLKSKIHIIQPKGNINAISSNPYKLHFYNNNSDKFEITVHRGERFSVSVYAVAQEGAIIVPTVVSARRSDTDRFKSNRQISQNLSQEDSILVYNLYSTEDKAELTLHPSGPCSEEGKVVVHVIFKDCPVGFSLSNDECICERRLMKYTTKCIIDEDISIIRNSGSTFWVNASYENETYSGLILYKTCPEEYCKAETVSISLDNPDMQCALNRKGVLCGACDTNHSLMLGSSQCNVCPNTYLALLLPFAAAGIALVVFLSILRLTVATGMINSIILYTNIVQVNRHLFFPSTVNVLTVFIAWMNLDFGFETCFYNGMTTSQQTLLQFAFPIYIWILITLIIITSRYSVRVSKLIGHNPIAVLATLLLMSYTKILKIIIGVYSSATLEYPDNKTVTVWLKDGNILYLQSWHLLLTVVTSLVVVFIFLPYTLLLLLGYKLYRFSGRKHMRWLNRLKPLLDSYYAPYKIHTRYWTGFMLLVRCALYIEFSLGKEMSLLAIIITFVLIALGLTLIYGRVYSNIFANITESLAYSNLIILSAITLAVGPVANSQLAAALVHSLVGMMFVIMMGIIVYHFHTLYIAHSLKLKAQANISHLIGRLKRPKEDEEPTSNSATKEVSTTVIELREPLLDI